jgi:transglutaminase-like putative cysteine protease
MLTMARSGFLLIVALAVVLASVPHAARAESKASRASDVANVGKSFTVERVPDWVVRVELPDLPKEPPGTPGLAFLAIDDQVRLEQHEHHYRRRALVVRSTVGVEDWSELSFDLDPGQEKLAIHAVRLIRDKKVRDALVDADAREFFVESDTDHRIYDGRKRILFVLKDVRVGDTLDFEYSIVGENPVFGGRYSDAFTIGSSAYTGLVQRRFLLPAGRPLFWKAWGMDIPHTERPLGLFVEHVFRAERSLPVPLEDDTPDGYPSVPLLRVSEHPSWASVASWARALFAPPEKVEPEVAAKLAELRTRSGDPRAQALLAIRFVQDDIRYLGIEMGESSHRPHPSGAVLAQRFGDCKDKTRLLVALLRGLGFQAFPALVDTRTGRVLDTLLPSAGAFNHAIVAFDLDGRRHFVDATAAHEGGKLEDLAPPTFGYALVLAPDTTALFRIPDETTEAPSLSVHETYHVEPNQKAATLTVESVFRRERANAKRAELAQSSLELLEKGALNRHARDEPSLRLASPFVAKDDRDANVLVTTERYTIEDYVRNRRGSYFAWAVSPALAKPKTSLRSTPLALDYPFHAVHEITVEPGTATLALAEDVEVTTDAFVFSSRSSWEGGVGQVKVEMRTKTDTIATKDVSAHLRSVDKARELVSENVEFAYPEGEETSFRTKFLGAAGCVVGGVVLFVVGASIRAHRKRTQWARKAAPSAGESAGNALLVKSKEDAARHFAKGSCGCKGASVEPTWTTARLGEAELLSAKAVCSCGETRRRYFRVQ